MGYASPVCNGYEAVVFLVILIMIFKGLFLERVQ